MKHFNNSAIQQSILHTLRYFSFFDYPPTREEIHTFIKKRCSKQALDEILAKMVKKSVITRISNSQYPISNKAPISNAQFLNSKSAMRNSLIDNSSNDGLDRYTLGEYHKTVQSSKCKVQNYNGYNNYDLYNNYLRKREISSAKLQKILFYVRLLSIFPQIKLIGLSGSVAMLNADEDHDVDLFIITAKNRLFTGRFIALILAELMRVRRSHSSPVVIPAKAGIQDHEWIPDQVGDDKELYKDKVCLNLFFDESNLLVPKFKKTEYVAHEVLQMKPLVQKNEIYLSFIDANKWVFKIFPNGKISSSKFKVQNSKLQRKTKNFSFLNVIFNFSLLFFNFLQAGVEFILKKLQLILIQRHRTNELISNTQLWFHPDKQNSTPGVETISGFVIPAKAGIQVN